MKFTRKTQKKVIMNMLIVLIVLTAFVLMRFICRRTKESSTLLGKEKEKNPPTTTPDPTPDPTPDSTLLRPDAPTIKLHDRSSTSLTFDMVTLGSYNDAEAYGEPEFGYREFGNVGGYTFLKMDNLAKVFTVTNLSDDQQYSVRIIKPYKLGEDLYQLVGETDDVYTAMADGFSSTVVQSSLPPLDLSVTHSAIES